MVSVEPFSKRLCSRLTGHIHGRHKEAAPKPLDSPASRDWASGRLDPVLRVGGSPCTVSSTSDSWPVPLARSLQLPQVPDHYHFAWNRAEYSLVCIPQIVLQSSLSIRLRQMSRASNWYLPLLPKRPSAYAYSESWSCHLSPSRLWHLSWQLSRPQ